MTNIRIYTDGGCSGNPGPGAWAYIVLTEEGRFVGSAGERATTNNRMELYAVIHALREVTRQSDWREAEIEIFTDSSYVHRGITEWIQVWKRNGWRTKSKEPVKNRELWQELERLTRPLRLRWRWLAGHAGHALNEECDRLVRQAIAKLKS